MIISARSQSSCFITCFRIASAEVATFGGILGAPPTTVRAGSPPQWQSTLVVSGREDTPCGANRRGGAAGGAHASSSDWLQAIPMVRVSAAFRFSVAVCRSNDTLFLAPPLPFRDLDLFSPFQALLVKLLEFEAGPPVYKFDNPGVVTQVVWTFPFLSGLPPTFSDHTIVGAVRERRPCSFSYYDIHELLMLSSRIVCLKINDRFKYTIVQDRLDYMHMSPCNCMNEDFVP